MFDMCTFIIQPSPEDVAEYRAEHPSSSSGNNNNNDDNNDDDDDGEGTNMLSSYKCACQLVIFILSLMFCLITTRI